MLMEDFLEPLGIGQYRLAQAIGVEKDRLGETLKGIEPLAASS
jgi:plasmid maintenance system antidote protein VapI